MFCEKCGTQLVNGVCPNCTNNSMQNGGVNNINVNNSNNFEAEIKKSNKGFIGIAVIIIALILIGLSIQMIFKTTPVKMTTKSIEGFSSALFSKNTDEDLIGLVSNKYFGTKYSTNLAKMTSEAENIESTANINIKLPTVLKDSLGFSKINVDTQIKMNQETSLIDLSANLDDEDLLNIEALLNQNNVYVKLLESSNNYYSYDLSNVEYSNEIEDVDVKIFIDLLNETINENIKNSDFKKSSETITVDDKEIKTTKYSLEINKELNELLVKTYLTKIKDNEDAIKTISILSDTEENEVLEDLSDAIDNYIGSDDSYYYNLYIKGSKLKRVTFGLEDESIVVTIGDKVIYDFKELMEDMTTAQITVENEKITALFEDEEAKLEAYIKGEDEKEFQVSMTVDSGEFVIDGSYSVDEIKKNSEYKSTMEMNCKYSADGLNIEIPITITETTKKVDKITLPDVSNAIDIENMTNEESNTLYEELMDMPIYSLIESLISTEDNDLATTY